MNIFTSLDESDHISPPWLRRRVYRPSACWAELSVGPKTAFGSFGSAVTRRAEDEQSFDLAVTRFDVG